MAKFDVFNSSTWVLEEQSLEEKLANKAQGAIGQKLNELRALKEKIEKLLKNKEKSEDWQIASELLDTNKAAFDIMQISFEFPDKKIGMIFTIIAKIEEIWKDQIGRKYQWRKVVELMAPLQPYLEDKSYYHTAEAALQFITSVQVSGNSAWEAYLSVAKDEKKYRKEYISSRADYNDECCDENDDGCCSECGKNIG